MIHELRSYVLAPGRLDDYLAAAGGIGRKIRGDDYGKLEGHFCVEAGNLDRLVHLWSYADFAERDRLRALLAKNARWADEFLSLLPPLVLLQESKMMAPVRPLRPPAPAPDGRARVYELVTERTIVAKTRAWLDALDRAPPIRERHGANVGLWQTTIGRLNEVVHLWAYPSRDAFAAARDALRADPEWRAWSEAHRALLAETESLVLRPSPMSPMM